jgi:phospholipid N-methyltransferase
VGTLTELGTFLRAVARQPFGVGAVVPSSPALAAMMVGCAEIGAGDVLVEVGAGTGPMTRALVDARPDNPLLVLEPDPAMAAMCRSRVPQAEVIEAYAQELPRLLSERGHARADRVISSLPFAGWPPSLQAEVLDVLRDVLAPDGRMVTFTYVHSPHLPAGRRARRQLESRFARVEVSPWVWRNMPPAFVYTCLCSA